MSEGVLLLVEQWELMAFFASEGKAKNGPCREIETT